MVKISVEEFDDYPINWERSIEALDAYKKHFPFLKVTVFAIPTLMTEESWKPLIERKDWIKVGIHGYTHKKGECKKGSFEEHCTLLSHYLKDKRYYPITKAPWLGCGNEWIKACAYLKIQIVMRDRKLLDELFGDDIPNIRHYAYLETQHEHMTGHPKGHASIFGRAKNWWTRELLTNPTCVYSFEKTRWPYIQVNLGCEDDIMQGWFNLDHHPHNDSVTMWKLGERIPVADNSCSVILIQHVLMYARKEEYTNILKECMRVLRKTGILIIKEDDNRNYIWKQIGTQHSTGMILSTTNIDEMSLIAIDCGFSVCANTEMLMNRYSFLNRRHKTAKGFHFVLECEK